MSAISGGSFRDISVRFQNFLHLCQWFSNFNPKISAHLQKAGQHYGAAFSSSSHLINCCGEKQEHITSLGSLLNASNYSSCHMPVWKSKWEARWLTRQTFLLICIYSTMHAALRLPDGCPSHFISEVLTISWRMTEPHIAFLLPDFRAEYGHKLPNCWRVEALKFA